MNKIDITSCPVCGSSHFEGDFSCIDNFATGECFHISHCTSCGFRFTDDAPTSSEIGRYYVSPSYISHSDSHDGLTNKLYHKVRQHMLSHKAKLVSIYSSLFSGDLLDIGCGTGYFPSYMQRLGWKVTAVEKSSEARDFAKLNFDLDVLDEASLYSLSPDNYDVITLWHVMEHIEELDKLWTTIYSLLRTNGTLILALPNCRSYDANYYKSGWAAYDVPRHLWHFTSDTIQRLAFRYKFRFVEELPMPFDGFYVSMLSEKNMGNSLSFIRGGIIGTIGYIKSLFDKRESSSMIYIFRKS